MKTYSVKEVREITGLTWKQLYEFKDGIHGIGAKNDAGYKQYSREDLGKLIQATLMAKLGAKPKEINKAFSDENYDRKKVLKELQIKAQRQLIEAQDILTVIENLLASSDDGEMLLNPAIRYLHIYAEHLRYVPNDKDVLLLEDYIKKNGEDELVAKVKKLEVLDVVDMGTDKASALIHDLKEFVEKTIGMDGNRFLRFLGAGLGKKIFGEEKAAIISDTIEIYMFKEFTKESDDDLAQLWAECIAIDYDDYNDENVRECVDRIRYSFMENFGLNTTFELLCKMESIKLMNISDEYLSDEQIRERNEELEYIINAVRCYEE